MRYVLTLDSDTRLPPGACATWSASPRIRTTSRGSTPTPARARGYGILQPHVVTPLAAPEDVTLYHWLFSGQCGIDPYSVASSEVYQDLFGEGTFTGKGLLHVQAMHAVLGGRLPTARCSATTCSKARSRAAPRSPTSR